MLDKVNISPGVSVLAVLRHLNYKPWFALGEFVDNSVESFVTHSTEIATVHGNPQKLKVEIEVDTSASQITIRDNAAGIAESDYSRAFRPAVIPPDTSGLAEFGMGMKSAACWFAPQWTVRTSALGEPVARTIHFDIAKIVEDDIQELDIKEEIEQPQNHYTVITLEDIFQSPKGSTVTKIKQHLTDIYRKYIRDEDLELFFNEEQLQYKQPKILFAPYYKNLDGEKKVWYKDIEFDFGKGLSVSGFAALRETGNTAKAGFALFRRGRVIQGSGDEGYRPELVFGRSNSYRYQRLFGELHLEGFDVSHTKDGFRWDENEKPFLELLREHLDEGDLPLLKQAEEHRTRRSIPHLKKISEQAITKTTEVMKQKLPLILPSVADAPSVDTPTKEIVCADILAKDGFEFDFRGAKWRIKIELTNDPTVEEWLKISDRPKSVNDPREISIKVSLAHPFMVRFGQSDSESLEPLLRVAAAISLAEVLANNSGIKKAGTLRRNVNTILLEALSDQ